MVINKDIVIIGGGIAGLWLLNRLHGEGYHAVLLDSGALGQGQSIASQGMIHGGMKYALGGNLTGATEAIADMPAHWKRCLEGLGEVNLANTAVLSQEYYLWPRSSLRSRLNAFFGSKLVRGKANAVAADSFPDFFRNNVTGPLYRLQDIVLNVPSLLQNLLDNCRPYIHQVDWSQSSLQPDSTGGIKAVQLQNGDTLSAKRFVVTSGEGAAGLMQTLHVKGPAMQTRPLHQVIVRHQYDDPVFVHCVSEKLTDKPELTITTHRCNNGDVAWYLGGELAESGVNRSEAEQHAATRRLLAEIFPWCDFSTATCHSLHVNRAEARQPDGRRPDQPSVLPAGNTLFCWPTKLTLAPVMASMVIATLQAQQVLPTTGDNIQLQNLPTPVVATPPWDEV